MVLESSTPNFCADCGAGLSDGASFCSQCGTPISSSNESASSVSAGATLSPFRQRVREYTVHGWEIEQDYGDRVVVIKRGFGSIPAHVLIFIVTGFTAGLANLAYAWYRYSPGASRAELRADGTERWVDGRSNSRSTFGVDLATAGGVGVGILLVLMGVMAMSSGTVSNLFFGLLLLAAGVFVFPPIQDRLNREQSLTTFGRERHVDTESAADDERCVVCGKRARGGVTRSFADKTYIAGIPLRTHEQGSNSYCHHCVVEEDIDTSAVKERKVVRELA